MRFSAWLTGAEFALFSRFGSAGGAPNRQNVFLGKFHVDRMRDCWLRRWSLLIKSDVTADNAAPTLTIGVEEASVEGRANTPLLSFRFPELSQPIWSFPS
jgi:hypothetical protein